MEVAREIVATITDPSAMVGPEVRLRTIIVTVLYVYARNMLIILL